MKYKYFIIIFGIAFFLFNPSDAVINKINAGDDVFIGEEGLDISEAIKDVKEVAWWESDESNFAKNPTFIYPIQDPKHFYVDPNFFVDKTGTWYQWKDGKKEKHVFTIKKPAINLKIWDSTTNEDVTDKSIPFGNYVNYIIETNLYNISFREGYSYDDGPFVLKMFTGEMEKLTDLIGQNNNLLPLSQLTVDHNPWIWVADNRNNIEIPLNSGWNTGATDNNGEFIYKEGFYTIYVICNANHLYDNYKAPDGSEYTGLTTSFVEGLSLQFSRSLESKSSSSQKIVRDLSTNPKNYEEYMMTPVISIKSNSPSNTPCDCSGNIYNCKDFPLSNGVSDQKCYEYCKSQGMGDIHDLDRNSDGDACEEGWS